MEDMTSRRGASSYIFHYFGIACGTISGLLTPSIAFAAVINSQPSVSVFVQQTDLFGTVSNTGSTVGLRY
jgi:hypothetical protein